MKEDNVYLRAIEEGCAEIFPDAFDPEQCITAMIATSIDLMRATGEDDATIRQKVLEITEWRLGSKDDLMESRRH